MIDSDIETFQSLGRIWMRSALGPRTVARLRELAEQPGRPGARAAPGSALFRCLDGSGLTEKLAEIWPGARLTRLVAFDKSAQTNWALPWHQDRVIAVQGRAEADGFTRWSQKDGLWHCEPPEDVFRDMLFLRLHLDACNQDSGGMEIALGSHRDGVQSKAQIASRIGSYEIEAERAEAGDVLVMSMLMLHRSPAARLPTTRRVLRADFACRDLPPPLAWSGAKI